MPEKPTQPTPTPPFDVRVIHQLVRLMKRYDLTAIQLVEGSAKINLRRRTEFPASAPAATATATAPAPASSAPRAEPAPTATAPAAAQGVVIESPMVGTYY